MIPTNYSKVQKMMEKVVCTYIYDKNILRPSIAYLTTMMTEKQGKITIMYVNNEWEDLIPYLYMHEAGHILFGHTNDLEDKMQGFLMDKLKVAYRQIQHFFSKQKSYNKARDFEYFLDIFKRVLLNVVMDLEVNSRMFSREEWFFFQSELMKNLKDPSLRGLWPEDLGLPLGRTWNEYLTIILMNPEIFMGNLKMLAAQNAAIRSHIRDNPQEEFDGHLTYDEYRRIRELAASKNFSNSEFKELKKIADKNGKTRFGVPTGSMNSMSRGEALPSQIDFIFYTSMDNLLGKIKKLLFSKKNTGTRRDQMFYTNRRKFNSPVIIPKDIRFEKTERPDLYLVIDVSGSVDSEMVNDFINTFKTVKKEFKHTILIFWDTELVYECMIDDELPNLYGGGTDIAKGISYVTNKYKLKKQDVLFVISDFCDYMPEWQKALNKASCHKYAINWNITYKESNPGFEKILQNSKTL